MSTLLRIPLTDGAFVLVEETGGPAAGPVRVGRAAQTVHEATQTLQESLGPITSACRDMIDQLKEAAPEELAVEFGVALTAEAGALIAKTSAECHLTITLTWKRTSV